MVQLDTTQVDYGDIVALQPNHCFVPTISALDLATQDLFHDVAGDPDLLARTPFDAVYYAAVNEEHVCISPRGAAALVAEIEGTVTSTETPARPAAGAPILFPAAPNPSAGSTRVAFSLPRGGLLEVSVYDVGGREVAVLRRGPAAAGTHAVVWTGRGGSGAPAPAGMYFIRCALDGRATTGRIVKLP